MANEVKFKRGLKANLPSTKTEGQVLFTTDTNELFVDISNSNRLQVKGSPMAGATASAAGVGGGVPAPAAGSQGSVLTGDGAWTSVANLTFPFATTTHQYQSGVFVLNATIDGITELRTGLVILLKLSISVNCGSSKINLNNLGAKYVYADGESYSNGKSVATGSIAAFVYDATANNNNGAWHLLNSWFKDTRVNFGPEFHEGYTNTNGDCERLFAFDGQTYVGQQQYNASNNISYSINENEPFFLAEMQLNPNDGIFADRQCADACGVFFLKVIYPKYNEDYEVYDGENVIGTALFTFNMDSYYTIDYEHGDISPDEAESGGSNTGMIHNANVTTLFSTLPEFKIYLVNNGGTLCYIYGEFPFYADMSIKFIPFTEDIYWANLPNQAWQSRNAPLSSWSYWDEVKVSPPIHVTGLATTEEDGFMSAADKAKLDGISYFAESNHPISPDPNEWGYTTCFTTRGAYLELAKKVNTTALGANNGVATLDANGKLTSTQLPDGLGAPQWQTLS